MRALDPWSIEFGGWQEMPGGVVSRHWFLATHLRGWFVNATAASTWVQTPRDLVTGIALADWG
jgi:hypothetical protein